MDLDLVCRLDSWGAEDFVAVSLGKNPRVVAWTLVQPHTTQSPFAQEFARRRELVQSAVAAGLFKDPVVPTIALAWAKLKDICLPEGLEEGVLRYAACGGGDSTMLEFERLNTALAERDSEIASLREQLATAETRLRNALPHTKKIETMKVVVAAMAVIGYGHDPFAK